MNNFNRMLDEADSVQLMCDYIKEMLSGVNKVVNAISDKVELISSLDEDDYDSTYYSDLEVDVETKALTKDLSKSNSKLQRALLNLSEVSDEFVDVWNILKQHDRSILL